MEWIKQNKKLDHNALVEWRLLSQSLDYEDTLIMKFIYLPRQQTVTFEEIFEHLNRGKIDPVLSKPTLRRKLNQLERDHLIKLIRTKPLIVFPIIELSETNLKLLIRNLSLLHKMERIE